jgi:hypothetical protein
MWLRPGGSINGPVNLFSFSFSLLSRPLLALRLGEYWLRISLYVYDRNRPLAPVLRQRRCSLMYDVDLTCIDDDGSCITASKYLEYNPGLELNIFLMNNEQ